MDTRTNEGLGKNTRVELRVLDPDLRHRIAGALQSAGIDFSAAEGAIELDLRKEHPAGSAVGARLVELNGEAALEQSLLAVDPDRARPVTEALVPSAWVSRIARRVDRQARLTALVGVSSLGGSAIARASTPAGSRYAAEHAATLDRTRLNELLAEDATVYVADVEQLAPELQRGIREFANNPGPTGRLIVSSNHDLVADGEVPGLDPSLGDLLLTRSVAVDSLRKRAEDFDDLAKRLLDYHCELLDRPTTPRISAEAREVLMTHHWPGGIDELDVAMERAALLSDGKNVNPDDLPRTVLHGTGAGSAFLPPDWATRNLRDVRESAAAMAERAYLDAVLRRTRGVIKDAAAMCGIGPRSLYDRMQQHQLRKEDYKR